MEIKRSKEGIIEGVITMGDLVKKEQATLEKEEAKKKKEKYEKKYLKAVNRVHI